MDTSNPAVFVNAELLRMHVGRRVRAVIEVLRSDGSGSVVGKSTDEQQLIIKGNPPVPLSNFAEVVGIADSNQSIQAEIWTNFGDDLGPTKLDDNAPTLNWAVPRSAESSSSSQVKSVYVKNLPKNITQDQLRELFEHHGTITEVILPPAKPGQETSRYGFVHLAERSSAMRALKKTEEYKIDGTPQHRGGWGSGGGRSSRGRHGSDSGRGRSRYNPY